MAAPAEVLQLVERFQRNREAYLAGQYNETQLRREFLDPFFTALGMKAFPVRTVDFSIPADKTSHDKMVSLVDQMLSLNKQLSTSKTDHEKTALQRQIEATDKQIDRLVYELYGLTEEIRIVEGEK